MSLYLWCKHAKWEQEDVEAGKLVHIQICMLYTAQFIQEHVAVATFSGQPLFPSISTLTSIDD